jgi:hypothetical protein
MSWKPAVPPPPVAGAAVGNGLGEGLGDGDGDADAVSEGVALSLALGLADSVGVPVGVAVGVADADAPGDNVPPAVGGEDPVQAETVAEASMVMAPQPTRVIRARSPRPPTAVRTFMDPPQRQAPESSGDHTANRRYTRVMT